MNKSELVAAMAAKTGESKASQERSLEAMLEAVTEALSCGRSNPRGLLKPKKNMMRQ